MDALPQAPRPSLKPKIIALYEQLFKVNFLSLCDCSILQDFVAEEHPFPWSELFLLEPRPIEFAAILATLDGNDFSSIHSTTQHLFQQGVKALQSTDRSTVDNALVVRRCQNRKKLI